MGVLIDLKEKRITNFSSLHTPTKESQVGFECELYSIEEKCYSVVAGSGRITKHLKAKKCLILLGHYTFFKNGGTFFNDYLSNYVK